MSNNDLINSYFEGAMTEVEKQDFLNLVSSDPAMKKEFDFQQDVIEGLKNARIAELKARLDNVAVGGGYTGSIISKVAVVGAVALVAGLAYYFNQPSTETIEVAPKEVVEDVNNLITEQPEIEQVASEESSNTMAEESQVNEEPTRITSRKPAKKEEVEINKPQLVEPLDLSEEGDEDLDVPEAVLNKKSETSNPAIDVEIDNSKKKYSFHYQLKDGRLFLYGAFDKGLYEILEFNTSKGKTLYLYYKESYYGLSKTQSEITPLSEVKDAALLNKLEQVRIDIKE
ncbi:hypothetical protein [Fulvivirga lutimaris]|uniref:hypothetical protein n=1 Tax=Fulvivirga lutimaris TaxID=1819566 RepID=UPI0012BC6A75|nr:hypothetical protein [Fulvivirga lutimaris]MTI39112.1 hypothetical protein [Fulvivirga lutimaris]